jgi:hypothetical protein
MKISAQENFYKEYASEKLPLDGLLIYWMEQKRINLLFPVRDDNKAPINLHIFVWFKPLSDCSDTVTKLSKTISDIEIHF